MNVCASDPLELKLETIAIVVWRSWQLNLWTSGRTDRALNC